MRARRDAIVTDAPRRSSAGMTPASPAAPTVGDTAAGAVAPRRGGVHHGENTMSHHLATRSARISAVALVALGGLVLAGCTGDDEPAAPSTATTPSASGAPTSPGSATPSGDPTASATPGDEPGTGPSATAAPASVPTDCTALVDAATLAELTAVGPLNDPGYFGDQPTGAVTPRAPQPGADLRGVVSAATQLFCGFRDPRADITGILISVATVDAATAAAYPAWLASDESTGDLRTTPSTCADDLGGTRCQLTTTEPQYGVEYAETVLVRDDVVVTVTQSNAPTDGQLMAAIVARVWG